MTTHIYWATLLGSHSFCEKSSSPSFIKDSPLGTMQKYESYKKKSGTTNQTNSIQKQIPPYLDIALKLRQMLPWKLNYSSNAFSPEHNRKARQDILGLNI